MDEVTYLHKEEVAKLLASIKRPRDKAIFTVMYYAGLRASEVGMLELRDLRLNDNRLHIHRLKNSLSGDHILGAIEARVLKTWMLIRNSKRMLKKESLLLFPSPRGGMLSRITIYGLFKKYAEGIGLSKDKCHPHILKHSIATNLLDSGEDITTVQDWLGHRDIRSTQVYAKVTNKRREEAAKRFYKHES